MEKIDIEIRNLSSEDTDQLHISDHGGRISLCVYNFIDNDSKQFVAYSPALDISGYGETEEKAEEIMKFAIRDYIIFLTNLSSKERDKELFNLGWKKDKLKNKEFSKVFVDINGDLKNFNAEEGSLKKHKLHLT